ncbi:uroporphyrinogen-III synthase [Ancylobacter sp. 6x-1]|uniref:Uroporphyrinogen-III synthase n=1 Tax=Ancylobacter crimeensis TaxID=2579147 RepID=A0ABT0DEU2_9HYPH|nr:uroporphyrinogen-III synthase [Ancylobacter crimeensis]
MIEPLLTVEPLAAALPAGRFDAVTLTSVNGARLLQRHPARGELDRLPLFAVGWRTAAAAGDAFSAVEIAAGNGVALAALLRERLPAGARVLHVAGEDRAVDLGEALRADGIAVDVMVIYRTAAARVLTPATHAALAQGQIDAVLHFSPKTAATLVALGRQAGLVAQLGAMRHVCLSANIAAKLVQAGWSAGFCAEPTEESLLSLLGM